MALEVKGLKGLGAKLANVGKVATRNNRRIIESTADKIRDRAREYAPEKTGELSNAIVSDLKIERDGRKSATVRVDGRKLKLRAKHSSAGFPNGYPYHLDMHEGITWNGESFVHYYKADSRAMKASDPEVGALFIDRAIDDFENDLRERMQASVDRELAKKGVKQ